MLRILQIVIINSCSLIDCIGHDVIIILNKIFDKFMEFIEFMAFVKHIFSNLGTQNKNLEHE